MKIQLQNKSTFTVAIILSVATLIATTLTTNAQTFVVYEKTEHTHSLTVAPDAVDTSATKFDHEYVIWDLDSNEYVKIHLDDEALTYFTYGGAVKTWAWNTLIDDEASGRKFSILSFEGDGEVRDAALADSLWGVTEEVEIENGNRPRVVNLARSYSGDGLTKHLAPNLDLHHWTIRKFELKLNDFQTKRVNDGEAEKLSDAIEKLIIHLERAGWRERGNR